MIPFSPALRNPQAVAECARLEENTEDFFDGKKKEPGITFAFLTIGDKPR